MLNYLEIPVSVLGRVLAAGRIELDLSLRSEQSR